ncbi:hypothetical protein, partial [Pseudomonas aeruginosa]|uniref:hypothetical protein n=1 Tax=Pseudomonas aeruginosa TaxID=287 RepID=UPI0024BE4F86
MRGKWVWRGCERLMEGGVGGEVMEKGMGSGGVVGEDEERWELGGWLGGRRLRRGGLRLLELGRLVLW